jgi:hypothetical protein
MTAARINARCGGDPALSVGRAAHGTRNRRPTTASPRTRAPRRNFARFDRRLRHIDFPRRRTPMLRGGDAHHHAVRGVPIRAIRSRTHELEVPYPVRSWPLDFFAFHFRCPIGCITCKVTRRAPENKKARRRCFSVTGLLAGEVRFAYRALMRLCVSSRGSSPAWHFHQAHVGAIPAQRKSARHRDAGKSERIARRPRRKRADVPCPDGHGCLSFASCSSHGPRSFRHAFRARNARATQGDHPAAWGGDAERKGMRPSDSSADPPAECLPVGGLLRC